jgi:hypothetical protein
VGISNPVPGERTPRRLIEELTATRADLAAAQHTAGVLAERDASPARSTTP